MGKRVTLPEASDITGLSRYNLYRGCKEGRYPHIRTSLGAGRILMDLELLEEYLCQEARDSVSIRQPETVNYGRLRKIEG